MSLEKTIRNWWGNSGSSVDKDEFIHVLLELLFRIEVLEEKVKEKANDTTN